MKASVRMNRIKLYAHFFLLESLISGIDIIKWNFYLLIILCIVTDII